LGRWKIQFCHAVSRAKIFDSIVSGPAKRRLASRPVSASAEKLARSSRKMRPPPAPQQKPVLPLFAISTGFAVIAGTGLLVAVPGALLGDRFGRRRIVFAGLLLAGVADVALLGVQSYPLFLVLCLAMGAADFFSSSQTAMLGDLTSVRHRALVLGIYRFAVDLGAFIGPLVLALLLDARGLEAAILLSSSALIGSAALVRTLYPRPSRRTI